MKFYIGRAPTIVFPLNYNLSLYSAQLFISHRKGDAYVTTECPAYLTSYNPKNGNINNNSLKDELDDIEREATPAIYDSIDHLNRRHDIPSAPNPMNIGIGNSDTDDNTADDTTGSTIMTS